MVGYSRWLKRGVLAALLIASLAPRGFAHAVLLESVPAADTVVAGPALTFQLRFNSRVDGKRSRLTLVYPDGKEYPLDIAAQSAPDVLNAPARHVLAGEYKVRWQVLAADGHITRGEFRITVR